MQLLVLAPRPVTADDLRAALPGEDLEGARVLVVSPAENQSALAFWVSDADEAIADAEDAASSTADALRAAGAQARGKAGEADPLTAVQDALATYPADRVVVLVAPDDAERYRDDDVIGELRRRFDVPVVEHALGA